MTRVPRRRSAAPSRTIDGAAVVIQTRLAEVSMLNATGTLIWQAIDGIRDEAALAALVRANFLVDDTAAAHDVATFLDELAKADLVEFAP